MVPWPDSVEGRRAVAWGARRQRQRHGPRKGSPHEKPGSEPAPGVSWGGQPLAAGGLPCAHGAGLGGAERGECGGGGGSLPRHRAGRPLGAAHRVQRELAGAGASRPGARGPVDGAAPGHLRRRVGAVHGRGWRASRARARCTSRPWGERPSLLSSGEPARLRAGGEVGVHAIRGSIGLELGVGGRVRVRSFPLRARPRGASPSGWACSSASAPPHVRRPSPRLSASGRSSPP